MKWLNRIMFPKYVIMKGIQIENRAIMFLGINTKLSKDKYYDFNMLKFSNMSSEYKSSNIHKRIYSFKQLLKWRRLLDRKDSKCLVYKNFKWQEIKDSK